MRKQTFRSDASRYGAILGGVEIVFLLAGALLRGNELLSLLELVVFIFLLYRFTNRRATLYGAAEGYSYGNGLRFIFWISIFAGVVCGAYEIVARTGSSRPTTTSSFSSRSSCCRSSNCRTPSSARCRP